MIIVSVRRWTAQYLKYIGLIAGKYEARIATSKFLHDLIFNHHRTSVKFPHFRIWRRAVFRIWIIPARGEVSKIKIDEIIFLPEHFIIVEFFHREESVRIIIIWRKIDDPPIRKLFEADLPTR